MALTGFVLLLVLVSGRPMVTHSVLFIAAPLAVTGSLAPFACSFATVRLADGRRVPRPR